MVMVQEVEGAGNIKVLKHGAPVLRAYSLFVTIPAHQLFSWVIEGCSREAIVSGQERTR